MRRIAAVLLVAGAVLLAGCSTHPATGAAFPAGCGPRSAAPPAMTASTAPTGVALPLFGGPVPGRGIAAGGGTVAAFAGPAWAVPDALYVTTGTGRRWRPVPVPAGVNGSLSPLAVSGDGRIIAGSDVQRLYVHSAAGWTSQPAADLVLLSFAGQRLVGLGGQRGHALLYVHGKGQPLPLPLGHGEGLAVADGSAIVALGQASGPARLFAVPLTGGEAPDLPPLPAAATSPVRALAAGPDGTLYLATAGGLFVLPPHAGTWAAMALPSGAVQAPHLYMAVAGGQIFVAADTADDVGMLWRRAGGAWQRVGMPAGFVGQPVADGARVWVPSNLGPVLVGATGDGQVHAAGIAAPVSVVASAAWRPSLVAAGWSGGLYFSEDGGRTWAARPAPGSALVPVTLAWTPDGNCVVASYAGTGNSPPRVYLSGNLGRTWWRLAAPAGGPVTAVVESPPGSGVWWVAEGGRGPGLYRSVPGRAAWTKVPLPAAAVAPLRLAAAGNGLWVQSLLSGLWRVQVPPAGHPTFTRLWGAGEGQDGIAANPFDAAVVYSGGRRTVDGGRTWGPSGRTGGALAFVPGTQGALVATDAALLHDGGRSWSPVWSPPGPDRYITGVAAAGPGRVYVAVQRLGLVVVDLGRLAWRVPAAAPALGTWTVPTGARPTVGALHAAAPSDPGIAYRLTSRGRLAVSHDGGRAFVALPDVALAGGDRCCTAGGAGPQVVASALAVSPTDPRQVYVGLGLQGAAGRQPRLGLWVSSDGGRTWRQSGLAAGLSVQGLAVTPSAMYAVAYPGFLSGATALWRSTDGGAAWARAAGVTGPVSSVAAGPGGTTVLAGGLDVVWRSVDGGRAFTRLTVGAPGWSAVPVTAVVQAPDGMLYAAGAGVARSDDGGRRWHVISEPVGDPPVPPGGLALGAGGAIDVATQYGTFVYRPAGR